MLLLSFGLVVFAAASGQYVCYRSAQRDLAAVEPRYAEALAQAARLQQAHNDMNQAREFVELYTFLRHPWPRTRLLSEIAQHLPNTVTLRELTIVYSPSPPDDCRLVCP